MSETARTKRPEPTGGVVRPGELLTLREFCKRVHFGEHALRQARRHGLRTIQFGRMKFILADDAIAFFRRLGEEQGGQE